MAQYYSTGRICEMFKAMGRPISKMTLKRLEDEGVIHPPPQRGGGNGQRLYTEEHLAQIKAYWFGNDQPHV